MADEIDELVEDAISGRVWTDSALNELGTNEALQITESASFGQLPEWAKLIIDCRIMEHLTYGDSAKLSADLVSKLSERAQRLVKALDAPPRPLHSSIAAQKRRARVEAYPVWLEVRHTKAPASHPRCESLRRQFNLSKAQLGGVFGQFKRGRKPKLHAKKKAGRN